MLKSFGHFNSLSSSLSPVFRFWVILAATNGKEKRNRTRISQTHPTVMTVTATALFATCGATKLIDPEVALATHETHELREEGCGSSRCICWTASEPLPTSHLLRSRKQSSLATNHPAGDKSWWIFEKVWICWGSLWASTFFSSDWLSPCSSFWA